MALGRKPAVATGGVKDPAVRRALDAVVEHLQIYEGNRGNFGDKSITVKDLVDAGILTFKGGRVFASNVPTTQDFEAVSEAVEGGDLPDLGLSITPFSFIGGVMLSWTPSAAVRPDVDYFEVWRSDSDDFSSAIQVGTSDGGSYFDEFTPAAGYYYWLRDVDPEANVGQLWPGTAGLYAESAADPSAVLDLLEDSITEAQLDAALREPISAVQGIYPQHVLDYVQQVRLEHVADLDRQAALDLEALLSGEAVATQTREAIAVVARDTLTVTESVAAQAIRQQELIAKYNNNQAMILDERTVRATQNSAFAQTLSLIGAVTGDGSAFVLDASTALVEPGKSVATKFSEANARIDTNEATITSVQTASVNGDTALAETISLIGAENGSGTAFILDLNTALVGPTESLAQRFTNIEVDYQTYTNAQISDLVNIGANPNGAFATATRQVQITSDSGTGTIEQKFDLITTELGDFSAQYTVKLEANGVLAGFGLAIDPPDEAGVSQSTFLINVDQFAVTRLSNLGEVEYPFIVGSSPEGGATVGINGALVVDGSITAQSIATRTLTADRMAVSELADMSTATVRTGDLEVDGILTVTNGRIEVDGTGDIRSIGKGGWGSSTPGFYMGWNAGLGKYTFSIGDGSKYLRYNGTDITIQGGEVRTGGPSSYVALGAGLNDTLEYISGGTQVIELGVLQSKPSYNRPAFSIARFGAGGANHSVTFESSAGASIYASNSSAAGLSVAANTGVVCKNFKNIGGTRPDAQLVLEPISGSGTPGWSPPSGGMVNRGGKLYFHDGGSWREVAFV